MLNRLPTPTQLPGLSAMLDDIGNPAPPAIARALGVSPAAVRRWIAQDQAPRPAMLALFWVTRWGLSLADAEAVNLARLRSGEAAAWRREADALRLELARVLAVGDFGAANDASLFPTPQAPRPGLQLVMA